MTEFDSVQAPVFYSAIAFIPNDANPVCAVMRVVDGDTVDIACKSGGRSNVRLTGCDTPETFQPKCSTERALGQRATMLLESELRRAETIEIEFKGVDKYQRPLGEMMLDSVPLEQIMVARGVAVPYAGGTRIDWCQRLESMT